MLGVQICKCNHFWYLTWSCQSFSSFSFSMQGDIWMKPLLRPVMLEMMILLYLKRDYYILVYCSVLSSWQKYHPLSAIKQQACQGHLEQVPMASWGVVVLLYRSPEQVGMYILKLVKAQGSSRGCFIKYMYNCYYSVLFELYPYTSFHSRIISQISHLSKAILWAPCQAEGEHFLLVKQTPCISTLFHGHNLDLWLWGPRKSPLDDHDGRRKSKT